MPGETAAKGAKNAKEKRFRVSEFQSFKVGSPGRFEERMPLRTLRTLRGNFRIFEVGSPELRFGEKLPCGHLSQHCNRQNHPLKSKLNSVFSPISVP
jgi:hypothetical protein